MTTQHTNRLGQTCASLTQGNPPSSWPRRFFRHSRSRYAGGYHGPFLPAVAVLLALLAACSPVHALTWQDVLDALFGQTTTPASTNTAPTTPDTPVTATAAAATIAQGTFVRPAIAVSASGAIHVAAEGPNMASGHAWTWTGKKWQGGQIVAASKDTAGRCYLFDVAPSGIIVWRWGNKEYGKLHGPGLYAAGKVSYPGLTTGAARLAHDGSRTYLMSKNGAWAELDAQGSPTRTGSFPAGQTGEKFDFFITPAGVWHTAHNGFSKEASAYTSSKTARQTWAAYADYPDQGNDLCYPSVCAVDGKAYCISTLGGSTRVQVMDAGKPRFPLNRLGTLGKATLEQRCPPRLVATRTGVAAVWRAGKTILAVNVEAGLKGRKAARVADGTYPAAAPMPDGSIALVFVEPGRLTFKRVEAPAP